MYPESDLGHVRRSISAFSSSSFVPPQHIKQRYSHLSVVIMSNCRTKSSRSQCHTQAAVDFRVNYATFLSRTKWGKEAKPLTTQPTTLNRIGTFSEDRTAFMRAGKRDKYSEFTAEFAGKEMREQLECILPSAASVLHTHSLFLEEREREIGRVMIQLP